MIVVTGAAGFIGSCLVRKLNDAGHKDLLLVDDFSRSDKMKNLEGKERIRDMDRAEFPDWLALNGAEVDFIFHMGARTDTTEQDTTIFDRLNLSMLPVQPPMGLVIKGIKMNTVSCMT